MNGDVVASIKRSGKMGSHVDRVIERLSIHRYFRWDDRDHTTPITATEVRLLREALSRRPPLENHTVYVPTAGFDNLLTATNFFRLVGGSSLITNFGFYPDDPDEEIFYVNREPQTLVGLQGLARAGVEFARLEMDGFSSDESARIVATAFMAPEASKFYRLSVRTVGVTDTHYLPLLDLLKSPTPQTSLQALTVELDYPTAIDADAFWGSIVDIVRSPESVLIYVMLVFGPNGPDPLDACVEGLKRLFGGACHSLHQMDVPLLGADRIRALARFVRDLRPLHALPKMGTSDENSEDSTALYRAIEDHNRRAEAGSAVMALFPGAGRTDSAVHGFLRRDDDNAALTRTLQFSDDGIGKRCVRCGRR